MAVVVENDSVHPLVSRTTQAEFVNEPDGFPVREPKLLSWRRPTSPQTFVINCDGSYRASIGRAGYGFIVRDSLGRVILGRAVHFETGDYINNEVEYENAVVLIEMLAIYDGLQHARNIGLMNVEIRSDSKIAISIINGLVECPPHLSFIYSNIQSRVPFFRGLEFNFVYRECNRAADLLSKFLKHDGALYFYSLDLPNELRRIINEDALGFVTIRF